MIKVFELAGDKITAQMAQTLIALIAEGSDDNDDDEDEDCEDGADGGISDDELRSEAVCDFLGLIGKSKSRVQGSFLYTGGVLFDVEWYIRKLALVFFYHVM